MMKSFALHLVIFFIVGSMQFDDHQHLLHRFGFKSSSTLPLLALVTATELQLQPTVNLLQPSTVPAAEEIDLTKDITKTAHDHHHLQQHARRLNNINLSTTIIDYNKNNNSNNNNTSDANNNNNNNSPSSTLFREIERHHHHQQQKPTYLQLNSKNRQFHHQTTKTPRMIQRLIGGHIKHSNEPNSLISNENVNIETTVTPSRSYFRKRTNNRTSSTYRINNRKRTTILRKIHTTTKPKLNIEFPDYQNSEHDHDDDDDDSENDEAFLEDPKELDNWDNGILRMSAGAGKEDKIKSKKKNESNKTLAEQVKDGKYGLIENELFKKPPIRPGVLSYLQNDEFPHDNDQSYGGLNDDDIWLAEDHLLVIKGGSLNDQDNLEPWPPIDDYEAPNRQIKIPNNPKIPPPFPVQLEENGPLQFIGNNKFTFINSQPNESLSIYTTGNENYPLSETDNNNEKNLLTGPGKIQNLTKNDIGYIYPQTNPIPWSTFNHNQSLLNPFLNIINIGDGQSIGSLDNSTDYFDEDDPLLYYPPPYSFVYKSNYTNIVPAGPLVPGIVLPPPPNSFSRLEPAVNAKAQSDNEIPFRQILTKISDYKIKRPISNLPIRITTTSSTTSTSTSTTLSSVPVNTISTTTQLPIIPTEIELKKEIVYAVTEPPPSFDKVRYYTTGKPLLSLQSPTSIPTSTTIPEIIAFVPKSSPDSDTLSQGNPIYYEYFDARKTPSSNPVYYPEYFTTSAPTPSSPTTPIVLSSIRPTRPSASLLSKPLSQAPSPPKRKHHHHNHHHKVKQNTTQQPTIISQNLLHQQQQQQQQKQQQHHDSKTYLTVRPAQYVNDDIVYITPKPEIRSQNHHNGNNNNFVPIIVKQSFKKKQPIEDFEHEVDAIRQTLQYYTVQQLQHNNIPRIPKSKPVYEYSFDATKSQQTPTPQFDTEPFKPMVKYSLPVDDINGFQAIPYTKTNDNPNYYHPSSSSTTSPSIVSSTQTLSSSVSDRNRVNKIYNSTPKSKDYYSASSAALGNGNVKEHNNSGNNNRYTTPTTVLTAQHPWVSIEKQVVQEINSNGGTNILRSNKKQHRRPASSLRKIEPNLNKFTGYFYGPPPLLSAANHPRQNNRYYEAPFINHISAIKNKLNEYQEQSRPQSQWSLENDTFINYITPRPHINPNAEYINSNYQREQFRLNSESLVAVPLTGGLTPHNSQRPPPDIIGANYPRERYRVEVTQQSPQRQQIWSLENDTLINYLPENRQLINPNAEYVAQHRQLQNQLYRKHYRNPSAGPYQSIPQQSQQLQAQPQQQQQQQQVRSWNLINDTYVNYVQPRQPINKNAELIGQRQQHQNYPQYFHNDRPQQPTNIGQIQVQRLPAAVVYPEHSLQGDTLVNYRQPYQPINPDSEFINIQRPILNPYRNQQFQQQQHHQQQLQQQQLQLQQQQLQQQQQQLLLQKQQQLQQQQQQQQQQFYGSNQGSNNYYPSNRQRLLQ